MRQNFFLVSVIYVIYIKTNQETFEEMSSTKQNNLVEICNPEARSQNWRVNESTCETKPTSENFNWNRNSGKKHPRSRYNATRHTYKGMGMYREPHHNIRDNSDEDRAGWMRQEAFMDCPPSHVNGTVFHRVECISSPTDSFCARCLSGGHTISQCEDWKTRRCSYGASCRRRSNDSCYDAHPGETQRKPPSRGSIRKCSQVIECRGKRGSRLMMILGCQKEGHIVEQCPLRAPTEHIPFNAPCDDSPECAGTYAPSSPSYTPTSPKYVPNSPTEPVDTTVGDSEHGSE